MQNTDFANILWLFFIYQLGSIFTIKTSAGMKPYKPQGWELIQKTFRQSMGMAETSDGIQVAEDGWLCLDKEEEKNKKQCKRYVKEYNAYLSRKQTQAFPKTDTKVCYN